MIRYPMTDAELRARIAAEAPTWPARAAQRTAAFRAAEAYRESSGIWGEVKPVYVRLQHNKCGFCERRLEDERRGRVEHDLEHFRPKAAVRAWPPPQMPPERRSAFGFPMGGADAAGYYLLAYEPWNYLAACKPCNTALKGSHFPIAGPRACPGDDPARLKAERPYLIYPIGNSDVDPAKLITFVGNLPVPRARRGHARNRASVVISFFELDVRESLLEERAQWIWALWMALTLLESDRPALRAQAEQRIREFLSPFAPHANCLRAFHATALRSPAEAEEIAEMMHTYLAAKEEARRG